MKTRTTKTSKSAKNKGKMSKELAAKVATIRELMKNRSASDAKTMFLIAVEVAAVKRDEKKYGRRSVTRLASELGCTAANLYGYAGVAETWERESFDAIMARANAEGLPLTFSHLVELAKAKVPSEEARETLIQRALSESLSVRKLTRIIRPNARKAGKDGAALTSVLTKATAAFRHAEKEVGDLERLVSSTAAPTPEEIKTSVETYERTLAVYQRAVAVLQGLGADAEPASKAA